MTVHVSLPQAQLLKLSLPAAVPLPSLRVRRRGNLNTPTQQAARVPFDIDASGLLCYTETAARPYRVGRAPGGSSTVGRYYYSRNLGLAKRPLALQQVYGVRIPELNRFWLACAEEYALVEAAFDCSYKPLEEGMAEISKTLKWPVTLGFSVLRWTGALRDLQGGMPPEQLRLKMGLSELQWKETLALLRRLTV